MPAVRRQFRVPRDSCPLARTVPGRTVVAVCRGPGLTKLIVFFSFFGKRQTEKMQQTECSYCRSPHHMSLTQCMRGHQEARYFVNSLYVLIHFIQSGDIVFVSSSSQEDDEWHKPLFYQWLRIFLQNQTHPFMKLVQRYLTGFMFGTHERILEELMQQFTRFWTTDIPSLLLPIHTAHMPHNFFAHFGDRIVISSNLRVNEHSLYYQESPVDTRYLTRQPVVPRYPLTMARESPDTRNDDFIPFRRQTIPVVYRNDIVKEIEPCCICMNQLPFMQTQCGHSFCSCILTHLHKQSSCPLCRADITTLGITDLRVYETMKAMNPVHHLSFA